MRSTGRRRIDASPSSVHCRPPGCPASQPGQQAHERAGVAHVDRRVGLARPRAGRCRGCTSSSGRVLDHARRARGRRPAWSWCRRRRGSCAPGPARSLIAPPARRGGRSTCPAAGAASRAARAAGSKRTLVTPAPPAARARAMSATARSASASPATQRATTPSRHVGCGVERHVDDVDACAAELQGHLRRPRRAGWAPRRAARAPGRPPAPASSRARRSSRGAVVPGA